MAGVVCLGDTHSVPPSARRTLEEADRWLNFAALALLLVQMVPFAVEQIRFAFYPQLADQGWDRGSGELQPHSASGE